MKAHALAAWLAIIGAAAFCLAMMAALAIEAQSQTPRCGGDEQITRVLTERYGERLIFSGRASGGGNVFRLYASALSGSWTLIGQPREGWACLLTAGEGYLPQRSPGQAI